MSDPAARLPRMPRRTIVGGMVYHVMNRAIAGTTLFEAPGDYEAFEGILEDVHRRIPLQILAYCLMPNHWHLALRPAEGQNRELARFMRLLTVTHSKRWRHVRGTTGRGHVYQGRFKSFPVQDDAHLAAVLRYIERNALRANLTTRAERWRWSSLWRWTYGDVESRSLLGEWPVPRPSHWLAWVNQPQTQAEMDALRRCVRMGSPYGDSVWCADVAKRLGLQITERPRGRPRVHPKLLPVTFLETGS